MHRRWERWPQILVLGGVMTVGPALGQDGAAPPSVPAALHNRPPSPEALRELPIQSDDRGRLMALQSASVLAWVCKDGALRAAMGTDIAGCYRAAVDGVQDCRAQLQTKPPVGRRQATADKPDISTFRARLRDCLRQELSKRQVLQGGSGALPESSSPDPVASSPQDQ